MNKRGQVFILKFMAAIFVLFLVFGYIGPFSDTVNLQRDNLDCTNTSISTGTQMLCLGLDMTLWYWVGSIAVAGIGILWARRSRSITDIE